MRRRVAIALLSLLALACRGDDLAAPTLRRPVEDLPSGASALVLASDLRNTWERATGHGAGVILSRIGSLREFLARPEIARLRSTWQAVHARTGVDLTKDLFLNATGDRAGLAFYRRLPNADPPADVLLVGEVADRDRFSAALAGLRAQLEQDGWQCRDSSLAGRAAVRWSSEAGTVMIVVQDGTFVAAATSDSLAARALAIHAGGSGSALQDPQFQAALGALTPHSILALERGEMSPRSWVASGFTWDPEGLHFEQVRALPARPAPATTSQRERLLRSLPDGSVLAAYLRPSEVALSELFGAPRGSTGDALEDSAASAPAGGPAALLGALPGGLTRLLGGEMGLVIHGVTPTALAPIPELGVVLTLRDSAAAAATLRFAEASLGAVRLKGKAYLFEDVHYGGRTFRSFVQPLSEALTPSYLVDGQVAIVTSSRQLMQQIIDTRRSGRRSVLTDRAFRRQHALVPPAAGLVAYGDPSRLDRALAQIEPFLGRWGEDVQQTVHDLRRLTPFGAHFPAGVVTAERETDRLVLRGWLQEAN